MEPDLQRAKKAILELALGRRPSRMRRLRRQLSAEQNLALTLIQESVVGVAESRSKSDHPQLQIFSRNKIDPSTIQRALEVRNIDGGLQISIIVCGTPVTAARGGDSVGHFTGPTGTITCAVRDESGRAYLLGAGHVLGAANRGKRGEDVILHPGPVDGGTVQNRVGILHDYTRIAFGLQIENDVDAALCLPDNAADLDTGLRHLGDVGQIVEPSFEGPVQKVGRVTGHTTGNVAAVNVTVPLEYATGLPALLSGAFWVVGKDGPFAAQGDSGALIVDIKNRAVGMLVGVANGMGIATKMAPTLERLGVNLM